MLELMDLALFDDDESKGKTWEGGADELARALVAPGSPVDREAESFFKHHRCDRLLGRLAQDRSGRVSHHRDEKKRFWRITPPPAETAGE